MKEASGELSMTAIAVVAIAAIGLVFTTLIWPTIRNNINRNTWCSQAIGCVCQPNANMSDPGTCQYLDDSNTLQPVPGGCPCGQQ